MSNQIFFTRIQMKSATWYLFQLSRQAYNQVVYIRYIFHDNCDDICFDYFLSPLVYETSQQHTLCCLTAYDIDDNKKTIC